MHSRLAIFKELNLSLRRAFCVPPPKTSFCEVITATCTSYWLAAAVLSKGVSSVWPQRMCSCHSYHSGETMECVYSFPAVR